MILSTSMLAALRCFDVAARHCHFTRAAAELHLTPGAISQHIRHLEDDLGVALFSRLPRGLALTDAGRQLHLAVTQGLAQLSAGVARARETIGALRVSCSPSFAMLWLMPRLTQFHRQHPDIEIKLVAEFQSVDRHDMQASRTDCAIRYDPIDYAGIDAITLMLETLVPVASPDFLAQYGSLDTGRLASTPVLHDEAPWDGAPARIEWQTWAVVAGVTQPEAVPAGQAFNLSMLSLTAARNHQGVAMGRIALIADDLKSGTLVPASPVRALSPGRYVLLTAHEDDHRLRSFTQWLRAACAAFVTKTTV